ncbi:hypothetical protein [Oceanobacillus caeni]|nr:hypothetical protein [Oceanobacillus caeni]
MQSNRAIKLVKYSASQCLIWFLLMVTIHMLMAILMLTIIK